VIPIIPDIAAEVLSASETPRMIHRKIKQYFAAGVKELWLIDPDSQEVEIWTSAVSSCAQDWRKPDVPVAARFPASAGRPIRLDIP